MLVIAHLDYLKDGISVLNILRYLIMLMAQTIRWGQIFCMVIGFATACNFYNKILFRLGTRHEQVTFEFQILKKKRQNVENSV